ncbi:MAG TPA: formate dehydrogenase accessory sulfurtransferase FdhD [Acidimicrobiales bacterium]|nr:formate dehydrogenase accessory sulfurtransferase FdhD [Acidimicrobiales bacterium]
MTAAPPARRVPTDSRLVWEQKDGRLARHPDELAVEEPLEVRVGGLDAASARPEVLTVTMRTPGNDFELALGWLLSEGVLAGPADLRAVRYCSDPELDAEQRYNVVTVDLERAAAARLAAAGGVPSRLTTTSSSCGVCGSSSIAALAERLRGPVDSATVFGFADVVRWPSLLTEGQAGFAATGGLHAAGLVNPEGELLVAREDIGRHNAVDKVLGWAILQAVSGDLALPLEEVGLVVSGRTSFEIVQKALAAGIPVVAGVSAASSLAVRLADERGITLLGFVRDGRGIVYSHPERLELAGG